MEKQQQELTARFDSRKSFYGKAIIKMEGGKLCLISYNTLVARINIKKGIAEVYGDYSQTTMRHIKEFLKQNGFKAENKNQILKDYYVNLQF